ncbi:MAG TPA: hypothetical protein VGM94_03020 [Galbitalea sp.]|jgi:hypothetical protein
MTAWREPTRDIPLRWGTYRERYLTGLGFITGGLIVLAGSNTYTLTFLLVGTVTHVAGWFILPARPARRVWVAWPSLICVWLLLTGPQILFAMVLPLLGWLVVRQRPVRSYVVLIVPVAVGIWLAGTVNGPTWVAAGIDGSHAEPYAFAIEGIAVIASAWAARALATTKRPRPRPTVVTPPPPQLIDPPEPRRR